MKGGLISGEGTAPQPTTDGSFQSSGQVPSARSLLGARGDPVLGGLPISGTCTTLLLGGAGHGGEEGRVTKRGDWGRGQKPGGIVS